MNFIEKWPFVFQFEVRVATDSNVTAAVRRDGDACGDARSARFVRTPSPLQCDLQG